MTTDTDVYTAESIINALKTNCNLMFDTIDCIKCPFPGTHAHHNDNRECKGDPDNCVLCKNRKCKQHLRVLFRQNGWLSTLHFCFMVLQRKQSGYIRIGFIDKDDGDLGKLIDHKFIEEEKLVLIKI